MTADELALLRGVEAAPDDDLPRLVYADWLDEHGRHARAEFIRVQCERASIERRLPTMTLAEKRVEGPRRGWLLSRQREQMKTDPINSLGLPALNWQDDLSGWWDWGPWVSDSYSRGFSKGFYLTPHCDLAEALRYCSGIVPRPAVSVHDLDMALQSHEGRAIFEHRGLWESVTSICLGHPRSHDRPRVFLLQDFIPLTRPEYPALRIFQAEDLQLNPGHVCVIAERLKAPMLEKMFLGNNHIVDSGLTFLHRAVYARSLKLIDLSRNPLCRPEARWLTPDCLPSLRKLNLRKCPIMPDSLARLRAELPLVEVLN